jgi:predicted transcriptional regulator
MAISNTELEVLKVLWDAGPGTVRQVQERLEEAGRSWAYTTVQTLLGRLQAKSFLEAQTAGRALVFHPAVTRDGLLREELDTLADRVCDGATSPLVLTLVDGRKFSPSELKTLRELIDRLDREQSGE